jgi:hypothetical protein
VFYTNLKSYNGNDTKKEDRLKLFTLCVESYKRFNPGVVFISEIVKDEIANTADMYFDKMRRIKDLNYNYNVLWVDADTICLEDIYDLFSDKMSATFWGHWDGLNAINGGVVYYPKRYLYDNFDKFTISWINLLSKLNEESSKFIGLHEQYPITELLLNQFNISKNSSIVVNEKKLIKNGGLFSTEYNINPFIRHFKNKKVFNECNTICGKKILHLNISEEESALLFADYLCNNLLGYTHYPNILIERCDDLKISNKFIYIKKSSKVINIINNTQTYATLYQFDTNNYLIGNSICINLLPGTQYFKEDVSDIHKFVLKNIFSGESQIIKNK